MAAIRYLDFDMRIEHEAARYAARVIDSPSGQASHSFDLPFSALELENFILRIRVAPRGSRRLESVEMQAAKAFGGKLFDAVFADEVRACLRSSLDEAGRQGAGLRIRLRLSDVPEFINVPWEFIYNQTLNRFLALSADTPLVRYMDLPERIRPLSVKPPLRILVMIASPHDYPPLNVEEEWGRLRSALADLKEWGLVDLELVPEATLAGLQRALRQAEYHIFHFVGHGAFDPNTQDGLLLMVDQAGRGRPISGQNLGTLLHDEHSLRLAVLNACQGARSAASDPFAGVAQSLVQQALPAVIAMQFEISDQAAITLSHEFYLALADGLPVDAALTEARKALYAQASGVEWATPVLYLRAADGRIFDMAVLSDADRRHIRQIYALLPKARQAMTEGNWSAAESAWKAILNLDPAHPGARSGFEEATRQRELAALNAAVRSAREQEDWEAVTASLEAVVQLDPGNADAIAGLTAARQQVKLAELATAARAAMAREQWSAAIVGWQAVVALAPEYKDATAQLATARSEARIAAQYAQAVEDAQTGRWRPALDELRQIEAQRPSYRDVAARRAAAEAALGDEAQRAAAAQRQAHIAQLRRDAQAAMATQQWDVAAGRWQALLELEPTDAEAQHRFAEARRNREASALYAQAVAHLDAGRLMDALEAFRGLRRQHGIYRDVDARIAGAEAALQREIRRAKGYAELRREAEEALARETWDKAVVKLEALLALEPEDASVAAQLEQARGMQKAMRQGKQTAVPEATVPPAAVATSASAEIVSGKSAPAPRPVAPARRLRLRLGAIGVSAVVLVIAMAALVAPRLFGGRTGGPGGVTSPPTAQAVVVLETATAPALALAETPPMVLVVTAAPSAAEPTGLATASSAPIVQPTQTPTSSPPPTAVPTMTATPKAMFTVNQSSVNVRSGPSTLYPVAGMLRQGETYDVIGRNQAGDWWQFDYGGKPGWVYSAVVSADSRASQALVAPTPVLVLGIGSTMTSDGDGMALLYVPAGEFLRGSAEGDPKANSDEMPQRRVYLDAFWVDRTEVTNAMFTQFVAATGHRTDAEKAGTASVLNTTSKQWEEAAGADWRHPQGPSSDIQGQEQHPVVQVSWNDAEAYCRWAGRRLPTEAEWEKAARGTDGREFPWGSEGLSSSLLNFDSLEDGFRFTAPVGMYPRGASPYGVLDMAGNVWEWVADWADMKYYASAPSRNPTGPASAQYRVLRGGSWYDDSRGMRAAYRGYRGQDGRTSHVGFRCARSL